MRNKLTEKIIYIGTGLLILFAIASQLFTLSQVKAFWLDEWVILSNIKYKSYAEIFGPLDYIQQFPRVYLAIVKGLAELTNYNYFALRSIPTLVQIVNIFLIVFVISRILYKENIVKRSLFVLFFLALHTTVFYFTQLKQYTMELFLALVSVYTFHLLATRYQQMKAFSLQYIIILLFIFSGSFFSYTFPFVVAPVLLSFLFTFIQSRKLKQWDFKAIVPLLVFFIAVLLNYFTDLRYVLNSDKQYSNFDVYVMGYDNLKMIVSRSYNVVRLLAYNIHYAPENHSVAFVYFLHALKVLLIFLTTCGIFFSAKQEFSNWRNFRKDYFNQLSFRNQPSWNVYMLTILLATLVLYFLKLLPLGQPRLNYYSYVFNTYFLICGLYAVISYFKSLKFILIPAVFFIAVFQIVRLNTSEMKNANLLFDQEIYSNVGRAIEKAYEEEVPLMVYDNTFYPASLLTHRETLMIQSHHSYKPDRPLVIYAIDSNKVTAVKDSVGLRNYIFVNKHSFILKQKLND